MKKIIAALLMLGFASSAQASTVKIDLKRGTDILSSVTCSQTCEGWEIDDWSTSAAVFELLSNSGDADELALVKDVSGDTSLTLSDFTKNGNSKTLIGSVAEYVIFKIGGGSKKASHAVIRNTSGLATDYTFVNGSGQDLSHTSEIGSVTATVPLPASGLLLGFVLAGGAFAARRKRNAA